MSELFLYDDAVARTFEPFSLTRPTSELRAGALLLRERWEQALRTKASGSITGTHLENFDEPGAAPIITGVVPRGSIVANSRCAVGLSPIGAGAVWRDGNRVAAVLLDRNVNTDEFAHGRLSLDALAGGGGGQAVEIKARWMERVWDFIAQLAPMLNDDIAALYAGADTAGNPPNVFAEEGAHIEPHVHFDTSGGPVLIRAGATVQAFTRIAGPCVIGAESLVGVDRISSSSIGPHCKIHGELASTIVLAYSNKGHDGFVGHSYLGRWVNLGAGTITSNLKNTYGPVHFWTPEGERDTGMQFLGTFFGDHVKTGIGTALNTGTVLGAGANIYGSGMPPKVVSPFAWGDRPPYSTYRLDKFLAVAQRAMARRHVDLSDRQRRHLEVAYERRWSADTK